MPSWVVLVLQGTNPLMTYWAKVAPKTYGVGGSASYPPQPSVNYEASQTATYEPRTL